MGYVSRKNEKGVKMLEPGTRVLIKGGKRIDGIGEAALMYKYRGKLLTIKCSANHRNCYHMKEVTEGNNGKGWLWHRSWFVVSDKFEKHKQRMLNA